MNKKVLIIIVSFILSGLLSGGLFAESLPASQQEAQAPGENSLDIPVYTGAPVSLKLINVSLIDFFRALSEISGTNILIDPDVVGTMTINVEQVPWDQLFDAVLSSQGLVRKIQGNLVRISTKTTLKNEEDAVKALKDASFAAKDTITVTRHLDFSTATDLIETFKEQLSERGQINVDPRTNTLVITDVPEGIEKIDILIAELDKPERQVEIEARIVEVTTNFSREIGVEFGLMIGGRANDRNVGAAGYSLPVDPDNMSSLVGFSTGKAIDVLKLDASLTAGESRGEARMLSKPKVSAQNNAEARITQGAKIPIPVQQNYTTTVRYETAALQLVVIPRITEENVIYLNIRVENSQPDFTQTVLGIPTIYTSESQTQVIVPDGGTTVVGGTYVESTSDSENKVPGLGNIPVIGNLFKKTSKEKDTREILFFITTKIIE
jgi:type IV pilus assembly protein PilQ